MAYSTNTGLHFCRDYKSRYRSDKVNGPIFFSSREHRHFFDFYPLLYLLLQTNDEIFRAARICKFLLPWIISAPSISIYTFELNAQKYSSINFLKFYFSILRTINNFVFLLLEIGLKFYHVISFQRRMMKTITIKKYSIYPERAFLVLKHNSMIEFIRFFDRSWIIERKTFSNLDAELLVDSWAKRSQTMEA